ncbi:NTP transferase domain-containing protein [Negadavirga shengliensis]|uniref:Probable molybdenum cofactor guanylyltransferase n=1 Tax=Negadavirga shengliensis TaxID=1389218 RepID=A0ABV9T5K1_9BACT
MKRPAYGEFGRNELGVLGTSCGLIQQLAKKLIQSLSESYRLAYVDADHKEGDRLLAGEGEEDSLMSVTGTMEFRDKILFKRIDLAVESNSPFERRQWFNKQDLILINANHFKAKSQILVIDSNKSLEKKLDKLTDVQMILLKTNEETVPDVIRKLLPDWEKLPCYTIDETEKITGFISGWLQKNTAPVNGLVLSGGKSTRMQKDKGDLVYHGKSQRQHMMDMLAPYCQSVYLSCNPVQAPILEEKFPVVQDKVLELGPMGGLISAFMQEPDHAWLTVACDLPYLTEGTIKYLIDRRNPSKHATAFLDPEGKFPEPLITIWEPRSYPLLLQFLSQGYSCPRKVLINTDIELLKAPDVREFRNINYPEEFEAAIKDLHPRRGG